jgi:hypothetical protein
VAKRKKHGCCNKGMSGIVEGWLAKEWDGLLVRKVISECMVNKYRGEWLRRWIGLGNYIGGEGDRSTKPYTKHTFRINDKVNNAIDVTEGSDILCARKVAATVI